MGKSRIKRTKKVTKISISSSSVKRLQEQDREALLRNAETLKDQLERLQLLNERLNGECVYGLSYPELWSVAIQLDQGAHYVRKQLSEAEAKLLAKQEAEGDETDDLDEKLTSEMVSAARRKDLRKQARELRSSSSSGERQEEHDHEALLQNIEHVMSEIERVRLLNERMCGKELDGLSYYELEILLFENSIGWNKVMMERSRQLKEESITHLEMVKRFSGQTEHGQSSMDNATYDYKFLAT